MNNPNSNHQNNPSASGVQPQPVYQSSPPNYYQPYGPPNAHTMENPGQTLGIVGVVLNFFLIHIAGIILGILSISKSKKASAPTALGWVSLIWGIVGTVVTLLLVIGLWWLYATANIERNRSMDSNYQQDSEGFFSPDYFDLEYPPGSDEYPPDYIEDTGPPASSV